MRYLVADANIWILFNIIVNRMDENTMCISEGSSSYTSLNAGSNLRRKVTEFFSWPLKLLPESQNFSCC